jgi:hypothetical protein
MFKFPRLGVMHYSVYIFMFSLEQQCNLGAVASNFANVPDRNSNVSGVLFHMYRKDVLPCSWTKKRLNTNKNVNSALHPSFTRKQAVICRFFYELDAYLQRSYLCFVKIGFKFNIQNGWNAYIDLPPILYF